MEKRIKILIQCIAIQVANRTVVFIALFVLSVFSIQFYIKLYSRIPDVVKSTEAPLTVNLKDISCYKDEAPQTLHEDLMNANRTIFFIESSCRGGLNSRQACSVESAASANPGWSVVVLFPGPLSADFLKRPCYKELTSIRDVQLAKIDVVAFSKDTPLENLLASDELVASDYPVVHSSDVLRILTLYKFGGVYLDLDVIVVRSFETLPQNFVGKICPKCVSNAIMRFSYDHVGRSFTRIAAMDLAPSYDPHVYVANGPALVERTLRKFCGTTDIANMSADNCHGIVLLEPKVFYQFPFQKWPLYYKFGIPDMGDEYTHHIWNSGSQFRKVPQKSVYARLAGQFCPKIFRLFGHKFGS